MPNDVDRDMAMVKELTATAPSSLQIKGVVLRAEAISIGILECNALAIHYLLLHASRASGWRRGGANSHSFPILFAWMFHDICFLT